MDKPGAEIYFYRDLHSPVGRLRLIASPEGLAAVWWNADRVTEVRGHLLQEDKEHPLLLETAQQLKDYFEKKRQVFDLPLDLVGTDFQLSVWEAIQHIPYGKTISYGDLARQLGDLKAVRAVGGALNKNPIPVIVPCHRIIGATGGLTGFGGGLRNKTYLLDLEDPGTQFKLWD